MTEQQFIAYLNDRIETRVREWRRTHNPRRRQILKHEIWTLESVLREYTLGAEMVLSKSPDPRIDVTNVVH